VERPVIHISVPWQAVQVRNRYVNRWMRRDVKRRQMVKQYAVDRIRLNALRRNTIIPQEIYVCVFCTVHHLVLMTVNLCNHFSWFVCLSEDKITPKVVDKFS